MKKSANDTFTPINTSQYLSSINFKPRIKSLEEPVYPSLVYCIQPLTTNNALTIDNLKLSSFLNKDSSSFFICQTHGLQEKANIDCLYCTPFFSFTYIFILETKYHFLTFPPPIWYSTKAMNFLKTFCFNSKKFTNNKSLCAIEKNRELNSYSLFVNMSYNEGSLKSLSTGKTSYIRNNILGFHTFGGRATLSIDATLSPQYAMLPKHIFDNLKMACPIVILNRAPSLKNTCIYGLEVLRNDDDNDHTIRINSYITEGLHADQDGDELSLFYIKHPGKNEPSHNIKMAIAELKKFTWSGGVRHDFSYKPRYEFTQYLKYILYRYNNYFCQHNKLWASIPGNDISKKCIKLMNLGCSIYPREVDEFLIQLSTFVSNLQTQLSNSRDILNGTGTIKDVVSSGAKGEAIHIHTYLKNLYTINPKRKIDMISNFNKYIESGSKMSINGAYQFIFLEAVNPLTMLNGHVYYNDKILMRNVINATSFSSYCYNHVACDYIFNMIATTTNTCSEAEVQEYLQSINNP